MSSSTLHNDENAPPPPPADYNERSACSAERQHYSVVYDLASGELEGRHGQRGRGFFVPRAKWPEYVAQNLNLVHEKVAQDDADACARSKSSYEDAKRNRRLRCVAEDLAFTLFAKRRDQLCVSMRKRFKAALGEVALSPDLDAFSKASRLGLTQNPCEFESETFCPEEERLFAKTLEEAVFALTIGAPSPASGASSDNGSCEGPLAGPNQTLSQLERQTSLMRGAIRALRASRGNELAAGNERSDAIAGRWLLLFLYILAARAAFPTGSHAHPVRRVRLPERSGYDGDFLYAIDVRPLYVSALVTFLGQVFRLENAERPGSDWGAMIKACLKAGCRCYDEDADRVLPPPTRNRASAAAIQEHERALDHPRNKPKMAAVLAFAANVLRGEHGGDEDRDDHNSEDTEDPDLM